MSPEVDMRKFLDMARQVVDYVIRRGATMRL